MRFAKTKTMLPTLAVIPSALGKALLLAVLSSFTLLAVMPHYVMPVAQSAEIDSDKATLTIVAESSGTLAIKVNEGETVAVGSVICTIDTEGKNTAPAASLWRAQEKSGSVASCADAEALAQALETDGSFDLFSF